MERLLLRPAEVAELIGIGRSKVYEMLASGELPSVRIGGDLRIPAARLQEWVDAKARECVTSHDVAQPQEGRQ
jgi:excisionase family DNA binding protein